MRTARSGSVPRANKPKKKPALTRSAFGRANLSPPRPRSVASSVGRSTAKPRAKSTLSKGPSSFDPVNTSIPPMLIPFGRYFPLQGLNRVDLSATGLTTNMIFLSCIPGTATIGIRVSFQGTTLPAVPPSITGINMPLLFASAEAGGPSSVKASKAGLEIENTTALLSVAGRVYVTNLHQRLNLGVVSPGGMTAAAWLGVADTIKAFPETEVFTGSHFLERKKFQCRVVDEPDYANFDAHRGPVSTDTWFQHVAIYGATAVERSRPMSTIVVIFDTVGSDPLAGNDYTVTCRAQHLTRWPLNTVPGQHMRESQAAPAAEVNSSRR